MYSVRFKRGRGGADERTVNEGSRLPHFRKNASLRGRSSRGGPSFLAHLCGCLTALLGFAVLVGWHAGNLALTNVQAAYVPMAYNTALCFLLSGLALAVLAGSVFANRGALRTAVAVTGSVTCLVIGGITLLEYLLHVNLGIDELAMRDYRSSSSVLFPGRPALNATLCILMMGIVSSLYSARRHSPHRFAAGAIFSSAIISIGIVAVSGYGLRINSFYAWANLDEMALHTSVGFIVQGIGLLSYAWVRDPKRLGGAPPWLPLTAAAAVATASVAIWQALYTHLNLWRSFVRPSAMANAAPWDAFNRTETFVPVAILTTGLLLAVAFGWVVRLAQRARAQSLALASANDRLFGEIRERSHLERQLSEANAELERRVALRTAELEEAHTGLRAANELLEARVQERTAELWREQQFTRAVLDNMPSGVVACDAEGNLTFFNAMAAVFHQQDAGAVPPGRWPEHYGMFLPDGKTPLPAEQVPLYRALQGETVSDAEIVVKANGGKRRLVLVSGQALRDEQGARIGAVIVMHDITERKRSETKFRDLLESAPDAIVVVDQNGDIALANARAESVFGYGRDELVGRSVDCLVPEEARGSHARHRRGFFANPVARPMGDGIELYARHKDGHVFPTEISLSPLETEDGLLVSAAIRDITDRKRQQEELVRNNVLLANTERDLRARVERERLINRIAMILRRSERLEEVQAAAALVGEALDAARAYIVYSDYEKRRLRVSNDWHSPDLPAIQGDYPLPADDGRLSGGATQSPIVIISSADADSADGTLVSGERAVTAFINVPLYAGRRFAVAMVVEAVDRARIWTAEELALVETIAVLMRTAIEITNVHQREHRIATILQQPLLPPEGYTVPGLDVGVFYRPAMSEANVGGDFCDVFLVDETIYAFVMGDISGKGLAAAVQVATIRNMLRCALYLEKTLTGSITRLNEILVSHNLVSGFAALFIGLYNTGTGELEYVGANSEPMLILRDAAGVVERLDPSGPPLGVAENFHYAVSRMTLAAGDTLLLYTDGLSEAGPDRMHLLGTVGVEALLASGRKSVSGAKRLVVDIADRAQKLADGNLDDDICLLAATVIRGKVR